MSRHGKLSEDSARLVSIIDRETHAALKQLAKRERRSVSNYVASELAKLVAAKRDQKEKEHPDRRRSGGGEADPVSRPAVA